MLMFCVCEFENYSNIFENYSNIFENYSNFSENYSKRNISGVSVT